MGYDYRVGNFLYKDESIYLIVFKYFKFKIKNVKGGHREGVAIVNFLSGAQEYHLDLTEEEKKKFENSKNNNCW